MYNEKIENLIKAALADGVLTEKEKQVLFKNAQAQGIDLDEFEMVLDAKLVELQKAEKTAKSAPKSDKYGSVRKCPACGAIVGAFKGVCPECGFEFNEVDANLSSKKLYELLSKEKFTDKKQQIIETFPLPNTKADLLEFLTALKPRIMDTSSDFAGAYYKKYEECIEKAKVSFADDQQILPFINDFIKLKKILKIKKIIAWIKKHWIITAVGLWLLISVISGLFVIILNGISSFQYERHKTLFTKCTSNGDTVKAKELLQQMDFSYDSSYDCALELIELYLSQDDIDSAIFVYNKITKNHTDNHHVRYSYRCHGSKGSYEPTAIKLLYNALLNADRMDEAWEYHELEYDNKDYRGNAECYLSYMNDVVNHYCKKGDKTAARKFVKEHLVWFVKNIDNSSYAKSEYPEFISYKVNQRLLQQIKNY